MLFEQLKEIFPQAGKIEPMVFSNAIGFWKYGLMRQAGSNSGSGNASGVASEAA
jgi:hypothetical protein